jgi:hypothetical protein
MLVPGIFNPKRAVSTAVVLAWTILITLIASGLPQKPSRAESEKVIRKSAYEMMKAFLTQDVAVFKRLSARRTLELVNLVYEAARRDPIYQQELQKARINNPDQFLSYFLLGMANQYLQAVPLSPEAAAIKVSHDSTVTFISDSEARIAMAGSGFARAARQAAGAWKLDLTDWLKRSVLKEIKDPELRAKIQKL